MSSLCTMRLHARLDPAMAMQRPVGRARPPAARRPSRRWWPRARAKAPARPAASSQSPRETSTSRSSTMPALWPAGTVRGLAHVVEHLGHGRALAAGQHLDLSGPPRRCPWPRGPRTRGGPGGVGGSGELLDPLHRKRQGLGGFGAGDVQLLQQLQQRQALVAAPAGQRRATTLWPFSAEIGTIARTGMPAAAVNRPSAPLMLLKASVGSSTASSLFTANTMDGHAQQVHQQAWRRVCGSSSRPGLLPLRAWSRRPAPRRRRRWRRP